MPGAMYNREEILREIADHAAHLFPETNQEELERKERQKAKLLAEIRILEEKLKEEEAKLDEGVKDKIDLEDFLGVDL